MTLRRLLLTATSILTLGACGPVYQMHYTFVPPEGGNGRACIFQCDSLQQRCKQVQDMEVRRCEDNAEINYMHCENRNIGRSEKDREYCYRAYCSSSDYESCEAEYRSCYQTCGGKVTGQQVCVSFCDQAQPPQSVGR